MSGDQIQTILDRLDQQDKKQKERDREVDKKFEAIYEKLDPVVDLYSNVKGFRTISLSILKAILVVGAAVGVIYGFIKWLKT